MHRQAHIWKRLALPRPFLLCVIIILVAGKTGGDGWYNDRRRTPRNSATARTCLVAGTESLMIDLQEFCRRDLVQGLAARIHELVSGCGETLNFMEVCG